MSTQHAGATRARATRPVPPRAPELQVVLRGATVRRGAGFVVLLATLLVCGLVGLLLLNLSMQKGAFELTGLQSRTGDLLVQKQALDQQLERIQSTDNLAQQATAQGMVPSTAPIFLDLADGSIVGKPVPAAPRPALPGLERPDANRTPSPPVTTPGSGPDSSPDTRRGTTDQRGREGQTEAPARQRGN